MNAASLPAEFDHHAELDDLEERLSHVDFHLERGIRTLIAITEIARDDNVKIPSSISEPDRMEGEHYPLCHALVCATMHKIWRHRRRYKYMTDKSMTEDKVKALIEWLPQPFESVVFDPSNPLEFVRSLDSRAFGALNPLTASQVLRVVLQKGEEATLSPIGILTLFSVVWALRRPHGETAIAGAAALDPWRPTAVITAKCVFGLEALRKNCQRRATLLDEIRTTSTELKLGTPPLSVKARWGFCLAADRLALQLQEFGDLSAEPEPSHKAVAIVSSTVGELGSASAEADYTVASATIAGALESLLQDARTNLLKALESTRSVIDTLLPLIANFLDPKMDVGTRRRFMEYCHQFREGAPEGYWRDIQEAATESTALCWKMVDILKTALEKSDTTDAFLNKVSEAYITIANLLDLRRPTIRWCESVVREQIAHASAGNDTDLDPAELVSAIAVSGLSDSFSQLETSDAIEKAKRGSRPDGSWLRGQPIYLKDGVLGVWPSTPDIVWMLCTALKRSPKLLRIADDVLMRFLHWIERTLNAVKYKGKELKGWSSELYRDDRTIDVWTTGVIVNALLEIRQILELRVSQLCEKRFTVIRPTKNLDDVDPIDLGATHDKRLHRFLLDVARETHANTGDAKYALVLHGPPGSSKTALANALANEMWDSRGEDHVLIRITPADFTRLGGEGLDFEARFIFRLLSRARRVTILFDEIDDLLRRRTAKSPPTFFNLVVPAMLNRLQDLRDAAPSQEICFLLATNYVDRIDPALIRPGRIDAELPVGYPDAFSRDAIFEKELKAAIPGGAMQALVERTVGLPFLAVRTAARLAAKRPADLDKILAGRTAGTIRDEQDSLVREYAEKHRWRSFSKPLLTEFFHVIASQERDQSKNRRLPESLDEAVNAKASKKWQEQFDTFCKERGLTLPTTKA